MAYVITSNTPIFAYLNPNSSSIKINTIKPNTKLEVEERATDWVKISGYGWIPSVSNGKLTIRDENSTNTTPTPATSPGAVEITEERKASVSSPITEAESADARLLKKNDGITIEDLDLAGDFSSTYTQDVDALLETLRVSSLRGVHGMPYQFMPHVDIRPEGDGVIGAFGRVYAERIVARMPLCIITPGIPKFLSGYSDGTKEGVIASMFGSSNGESMIDQLFDKDGRYYTFKQDGPEYYKYINAWLRAAAKFLDIENEVVDGTQLGNFDWQSYTNGSLHSRLAYRHSIAFYIDSENQISENFSNDTTKSGLESKINGFSDVARELNFVLGGVDNSVAEKVQSMIGQESLLENQENVSEFSQKLLGKDGFFTKILNSAQTIVAGGKLIFPEIWSDSSYGRSYTINFKFRSPDQDVLSWYLNVLVPTVHVLGLGMPRGTGANGYIAPFLIRAFYKGFFNIDMGIITDISVNKGGEGEWNQKGLPTTMDVSISIKDLYGILTMSNNDNLDTGLLNNIALMDYIANSCGININESDIVRTITMWYQQNVRNKVTDALKINIMDKFDQWSTTRINNLALLKRNS